MNDFTTDNSDLFVRIAQCHYRTDKYMKAKIKLIGKKNGIVYDTGTHKLYFDKIKHWKKYDGTPPSSKIDPSLVKSRHGNARRANQRLLRKGWKKGRMELKGNGQDNGCESAHSHEL